MDKSWVIESPSAFHTRCAARVLEGGYVTAQLEIYSAIRKLRALISAHSGKISTFNAMNRYCHLNTIHISERLAILGAY